MGTISYMSPEQLEGNVAVGTDIYALGCVLFQMLTGELPYTGATEQVMMGHLLRPIPSIVERSQGQEIVGQPGRAPAGRRQARLAVSAHRGVEGGGHRSGRRLGQAVRIVEGFDHHD